MKHLRPITKSLWRFSLLSSLLLLSACLNDDNHNCSQAQREISVLLKSDINTSGTDVFASVVKHVDLYLYDATGTLYQHEKVEKETLETENYLHKLFLEPGNYTLVAWMNQSEEYETTDTWQQDAARMKLKFGKTGEITTDTPPIYFGNVGLEVENKDMQTTVNLMKNTNYISVHTRFDRELPASARLHSYLTGTNGVNDFENNCPGDAPVYTYMPVQPLDSRAEYSHLLHFTTQRLIVGDDLRLVITLQEDDQPEKTLVDIALTETIQQNPDYAEQEALDRNDRYELEFSFRNNGGDDELTLIQVNDWEVNHSGGEL